MKTKLVALIVICQMLAKAQIINSSCQTTDTILKKLNVDASRLALRHTLKIADPYKDSVTIHPQFRKRYLDALVAVYNATALPMYDSLFSLLRIHTNPLPEMNNMNVKASPSLMWMQELYNNVPPASSPVINALMQRYTMQYLYLQSTLSDVVIFRSDTCLNLPAQSTVYIGQGALSAGPDTGFDDVRNITDSLTSGFVILNYSYGWGTCNDGCDRRRTWMLKVYTDCRVEYLGSEGPSLFLSIEKNSTEKKLRVMNPAKDKVIKTDAIGPVVLTLVSFDGRLIFSGTTDQRNEVILPESISAGLYLLRIQGDNFTANERLLVE
jgi:hypothetical protein